MGGCGGEPSGEGLSQCCGVTGAVEAEEAEERKAMLGFLGKRKREDEGGREGGPGEGVVARDEAWESFGGEDARQFY